MGNLLFSPSGRIGPDEFMRGVYVVVAVSFLINLLPMVSVTLSSPLKLLMIGAAYCWVALFIKRFRDGGKSGWMVLIPIFISIMAMFIHNSVVPPMFAPEIYTSMQEATMELAANGGSVADIMAGSMQLSKEYAEPLAKKIALPGSIIYALWSLAIAILFNKMIKSV